MATNCPTPSKWLTEGLSNERWFGDVRPNWKYLQSARQAQIERRQRSRLLRKHGHIEVATVLESCAPRARCLSGCCPECGRAFQRFVAQSTNTIFVPSSAYNIVSIVGRTRRGVGQLDTFSPERFIRPLLQAFKRGGVKLALGGIDYSLNEFGGQVAKSHWKPHYWLIVHNANRSRWQKVLREKFGPRAAVPRPIRVTNWDGRIDAIGYALKTQFNLRRIITTRRHVRGVLASCRNTRVDKLRSHERAELFLHLHQIGLEARLVLYRLAKIRGELDVAE